jgi:catechol 2,3-dioxygenase-like lactoylglutathione lyase family enzyme
MVWPWPSRYDAHDPAEWRLVMGRFDMERWHETYAELFARWELVHNHRDTVKIEVSEQRDGAFAVVDIDTLWRSRDGADEMHWKGRVCKVYSLIEDEWKMTMHTGALTYPDSTQVSPPGLDPGLRIDHVVIAVSDWERSNSFYRDVLGAEVEQRDRWFGHYRFGDWQLNVHGPGFEGLNAVRPVEPGNTDLCLVWPGPIESAVAHLERHGVALEAGPLESGPGPGPYGRHVYFRDPDGSLLEFVSYQR